MANEGLDLLVAIFRRALMNLRGRTMEANIDYNGGSGLEKLWVPVKRLPKRKGTDLFEFLVYVWNLSRGPCLQEKTSICLYYPYPTAHTTLHWPFNACFISR